MRGCPPCGGRESRREALLRDTGECRRMDGPRELAPRRVEDERIRRSRHQRRLVRRHSQESAMRRVTTLGWGRGSRFWDPNISRESRLAARMDAPFVAVKGHFGVVVDASTRVDHRRGNAVPRP